MPWTIFLSELSGNPRISLLIRVQSPIVFYLSREKADKAFLLGLTILPSERIKTELK